MLKAALHNKNTETHFGILILLQQNSEIQKFLILQHHY